MVSVEVNKGGVKQGSGSPLKFYILVALATLTGLGASYLFSTGSFLYGTVLLVLFLTLFVTESLLISSRFHLIAAVVLNSVAFAIPFAKPFSLFFLGGFIILVLFLINGAYSGRREMDNMVKIHFTRLVRVISRSMITAVVVFLSVVIILNNNFSASRASIDRLVDITTPIISRFVNGFSGGANTGELLKSITEKELSGDKNFIALSVRDRRTVVENQANELKLKIEELTGITIDSGASIRENAYEMINTKLSSLTPKAQIYWSMVLIAVLWLSIQSVEFLIYLPLAVLVFLVYELLFAMKFITMQMEMRSKEVISLR